MPAALGQDPGRTDRRDQQAGMSFSQGNNTVDSEADVDEVSPTTQQDLAGITNAREELTRIGERARD